MFTKKRPDGTYIKNLHFFNQIMPYVMPKRSDAVIYFEQEFDVTRTIEFIHKKRRETEGLKISLFYVILYAVLRTVIFRPKLNRFVSGYRYYQRNRISFNFVAKREMTDEGEEINVTKSFSPFMTLEQFCNCIDEHIFSLKQGKSTDTEKLNLFVAKLPRPLIKFVIGMIKFLDYHNALPMSAIDSLPFYSTVFFTNVGSIGIDAPFHHNFEMGNCGFFCSIGKVRKLNVLNKDGSIETRDKIKITFTYDDRITDGIYCARGLELVRDFVENPEKLQIPPEITAKQLGELKLSNKELQIDHIGNIVTS